MASTIVGIGRGGLISFSLQAPRAFGLRQRNITTTIRRRRSQEKAKLLARKTSLVTVVRAARMESKAVPLASRCPPFQLNEPLTGKVWTLDEFEAYPTLVVMFICNHCPFVVHLKKDLMKLANEYIPKGVGIVAISSNSVKTHPQDGPDFMAKEAETLHYPFPYLYDETQEVAEAFGAACTPDFFVYKKDGRRPFELAYHGQFDDSRPNSNRPITGRDLRNALDCVLSGRAVTGVQRPSLGCSIKWHPTVG